MFRTFLNIFKIPELRNKVLFTLGLLAIYRIGFYVPVPGVDQNKMAAQAVGAKAAAIRKKLEGMWVKTMVLRSPKRLEILAASQRDTAVSTW